MIGHVPPTISQAGIRLVGGLHRLYQAGAYGPSNGRVISAGARDVGVSLYIIRHSTGKLRRYDPPLRLWLDSVGAGCISQPMTQKRKARGTVPKWTDRQLSILTDCMDEHKGLHESARAASAIIPRTFESCKHKIVRIRMENQ
jgi:hypothetical protein